MSVILLTGLSGSGKTTIANGVKEYFNNKNIFIIDGDEVRSGLNRDLGFCDIDREENIRRISEVTKIILNNTEITVILSVIAPLKCIRKNIKEIVYPYKYYEIFVKCPLYICEERDPKRLYKLARSKSVNVMTGLGSRYEEPDNPDLIVETNILTAEESINKVVNFIKEKETSI